MAPKAKPKAPKTQAKTEAAFKRRGMSAAAAAKFARNAARRTTKK